MGSESSARNQNICGHCRAHAAVTTVRGFPLCVDCYSRLQNAEHRRIETALEVQDELGRISNFLADQIDRAVGFPGLAPRYQVRPRKATFQTGPVTQNIEIRENAIGVLNTGIVEHLNASIGDLRKSGDAELADALKQFVEITADAEGLPAEKKSEVVEGIDLLLEEIDLPPEQQRRGLLKAVVEKIRDAATTVSAISTAWERLEPLLRRAFQHLF